MSPELRQRVAKVREDLFSLFNDIADDRDARPDKALSRSIARHLEKALVYVDRADERLEE